MTDVNTNPYTPPTSTEVPGHRFANGFLLLVACWLVVIATSSVAFGMSGLAPAAVLIAISWFLFSRSRNPMFYPINRKRMTLIELLTIVGVCAILHGLSLPAVQSGPHRRRSVPQLPAGAPATQTNGGEESSGIATSEH